MCGVYHVVSHVADVVCLQCYIGQVSILRDSVGHPGQIIMIIIIIIILNVDWTDAEMKLNVTRIDGVINSNTDMVFEVRGVDSQSTDRVMMFVGAESEM